jgi:uncharacterized protein (DUF2461 family)
MYAPQMPQLQAVREHIAANSRRLRAIVESPSFKRVLGRLQGEKLQRVPRGFDPDHPRAGLLRRKGLIVSFTDLPRALLVTPKLVDWLVAHARQAVPVVEWLAALDEPD